MKDVTINSELNPDACPGVKERLINQSKTDLKNKNPDDLEYLSELIVGSGSHVQYYHAQQLKLLCRKYRTITQLSVKKNRRYLVRGAIR